MTKRLIAVGGLKINMAYASGLMDGADWDLGGFASPDDAVTLHGWDDATISAMGATACRRAWGVPVGEDGDDSWGEACRDYNRGCRDAMAKRLGMVLS